MNIQRLVIMFVSSKHHGAYYIDVSEMSVLTKRLLLWVVRKKLTTLTAPNVSRSVEAEGSLILSICTVGIRNDPIAVIKALRELFDFLLAEERLNEAESAEMLNALMEEIPTPPVLH